MELPLRLSSMQLDFKPSQRILQQNGYIEEKINNVYNWKKQTGKKDFPRFHVVIDDKVSIHVDKKRRHGFMQKWMGFTSSSNIVHNSKQIREEAMFLKLDTYEAKLKEIRKNLQSMITEIKLMRNKIY